MLILPKPVKDEFLPGFIRRLCHINFVDSTDELLIILRENFSTNTSGRKSDFKAISLATGISEADILWNYSHFPINLQFPLRDGLINYTLDERRPPGLIPPAWYRYRLCPDCLEQRKHGLNFWNRAHQIPALYWCPEHKTALRQCRIFPSAPHMPCIETTDEILPPSAESDIHKHQKIQYFSDILTSPHKTPYGATAWDARVGINNILRAHGFGDFYTHVKSKYLIDLAFENFPQWWLNKLCEDVRKAPDKQTPAIDKLFRHRNWHYYEYALAIVLLLTPEEWARNQPYDDALISIHDIERVNEHVWKSIT